MSVLTHSPPPPPPAWTSSHLGTFKHSHMLSQGLHSLHGGAIYDRYHVFCHHLKMAMIMCVTTSVRVSWEDSPPNCTGYLLISIRLNKKQNTKNIKI